MSAGPYAQRYTYDVCVPINCDFEERIDLVPDASGVQPVITGSKLLLDIIPAGAGAPLELRSETLAGLVIAGDGRSFVLTVTQAQHAALGVGAHRQQLRIERVDGKRFELWAGSYEVAAL